MSIVKFLVTEICFPQLHCAVKRHLRAKSISAMPTVSGRVDDPDDTDGQRLVAGRDMYFAVENPDDLDVLHVDKGLTSNSAQLQFIDEYTHRMS